MQRICHVSLVLLLLVAGCARETPRRGARRDRDHQETARRVQFTSDRERGSSGDEVVSSLPEMTVEERYEAALLESVDHLAEKNYKKALAALITAQKLRDTGAVQREIDRVRAVLDRNAATEKAIADVRTILDDGRPDEAAALAGQALATYGGGDRASAIAHLKQQADAVITASADNTNQRCNSLTNECNKHIKAGNLRAAAVALEQAIALRADAALSERLAELKGKLKNYDENRWLAAGLRRDPARLEEALGYLRKARAAWDTPEIRHEIDEYSLILERRRDRVAIADFEVRGDVGVPAAGRSVAEEMVPHLRPRFDVVERAQLNKVLAELELTSDDLADSAAARKELARSSRVRYLVVGSITPLAGVTVHARLIEASSGLVVQTARASAPTLERLLPKLKEVALILQLNDEQKLAYEAKCAKSVEVIRPVAATPIDRFEEPPPPPAVNVPPPPPIVTYTPRPPALGGVVIQDFAALPPVAVVQQRPRAAVVIEGERKNRLIRLSLEVGDNLFRRGQCREAQRHFQLALSLAGPRREISLRVDSCRKLAPPPVIVPQPVIRPSVVISPPPVVVVQRPRLAILSFVPGGDPGLVPAAMGDWAADSIAPYFGGGFELIERGEVCWYMGRLGVTMRDLVRDPGARLALARAVNARFFVFGTIEPTASFNVTTHIVDAETGARTGTGAIHVKDQAEMKLRLGELANQMGGKPAEQKQLAAQSLAAEKALNESRRFIASNPTKAAEAARAGLKTAPNNVALAAVLQEAEKKQRLAALEAQRLADAAKAATIREQARKQQEELARQAALVRQKAEAAAKASNETTRRQQQLQRERGAEQLRAQAKQARARGDHASAVQLLQSATALKSDEALFRELAEARAAVEKARLDAVGQEQKKREATLAAQRETARKRIEADRLARVKAEAERKQAQQTRDKGVYDTFMSQARVHLTRKEYPQAIAAAQSARKVNATPESAAVLQQAQDAIARAEAEKKGAAEKARLAQELAQRQATEAAAKKNQQAYLAALDAGGKLMAAKKYNEAAVQYQAALKLFRTDAALNGLKAAEQMQAQERSALATQNAAKQAEAKKAQQVKDLLSQGQKALAAKQYPQAITLFRQASQLSPGNVEALTGLSRAERERDAEAVRAQRAQQDKKREDDYRLALSAAQAALKARNYQGAVNAFNQTLAIKPNDPVAKAGLAEAQRQMNAGQTNAKESSYQAAMNQAKAMMAAKRFPDAVKAYEQALTQKPGDIAASQGKIAAVAAQAPKPDPKAEEAKRREAAYTAAMNHARTLVASKRHAEAIKAYDQALAQKPGDTAATQGKNAAVAAQAASKPTPGPAPKPATPAPNAQAEYLKALQQGTVMEQQRKFPNAVTFYQQAVKLATDLGNKDLQAQAYLGIARCEHAQRRYPQAVTAYEEVLKRKADSVEAKAGLARARANRP